MQSRYQQDPRTSSAENETALAEESELNILRDVLRMLPTGITVQDERSLSRNQEIAVERLTELVARALAPPPPPQTP